MTKAVPYSTFKYKMHDLCEKRPASIEKGKFLGLCEKYYGVSAQTHLRDMKCGIRDKQSIPEERLRAYSKFYNVPITHLINVKNDFSESRPWEELARIEGLMAGDNSHLLTA